MDRIRQDKYFYRNGSAMRLKIRMNNTIKCFFINREIKASFSNLFITHQNIKNHKKLISKLFNKSSSFDKMWYHSIQLLIFSIKANRYYTMQKKFLILLIFKTYDLPKKIVLNRSISIWIGAYWFCGMSPVKQLE